MGAPFFARSLRDEWETANATCRLFERPRLSAVPYSRLNLGLLAPEGFCFLPIQPIEWIDPLSRITEVGTGGGGLLRLGSFGKQPASAHGALLC